MTTPKVKSITLPIDFFESLTIYLRTSGADTMQQKKLKEWIMAEAIITYEEPSEEK